jgi:hypothetical protein
VECCLHFLPAYFTGGKQNTVNFCFIQTTGYVNVLYNILKKFPFDMWGPYL